MKEKIVSIKQNTKGQNKQRTRTTASPLTDKPEHEKRQTIYDLLRTVRHTEVVKIMKKSQETIGYVADALKDENAEVVIRASWNLSKVAEKGVDIIIAVPALADALKHNDPYVRHNAAAALGFAAQKGADISNAIPALIDALKKSKIGVKDWEFWVLEKTEHNTKTKNITISALVGALKNENADVRANAARILKSIAEKRKCETRTAITIEINVLLRSEWFGKECANYSDVFIEIVNYCAEIMVAARDAEKKKMAQKYKRKTRDPFV